MTRPGLSTPFFSFKEIEEKVEKVMREGGVLRGV
jgi:hypothetical protein